MIQKCTSQIPWYRVRKSENLLVRDAEHYSILTEVLDNKSWSSITRESLQLSHASVKTQPVKLCDTSKPLHVWELPELCDSLTNATRSDEWLHPICPHYLFKLTQKLLSKLPEQHTVSASAAAHLPLIRAFISGKHTWQPGHSTPQLHRITLFNNAKQLRKNVMMTDSLLRHRWSTMWVETSENISGHQINSKKRYLTWWARTSRRISLTTSHA